MSDYTKYKLRTCQSMHFCEICTQKIEYGQKYYDGGYGRRAHDLCADADALEQEETRKMQADHVEYYKADGEE